MESNILQMLIVCMKTLACIRDCVLMPYTLIAEDPQHDARTEHMGPFYIQPYIFECATKFRLRMKAGVPAAPPPPGSQKPANKHIEKIMTHQKSRLCNK